MFVDLVSKHDPASKKTLLILRAVGTACSRLPTTDASTWIRAVAAVSIACIEFGVHLGDFLFRKFACRHARSRIRLTIMTAELWTREDWVFRRGADARVW